MPRRPEVTGCSAYQQPTDLPPISADFGLPPPATAIEIC